MKIRTLLGIFCFLNGVSGFSQTQLSNFIYNTAQVTTPLYYNEYNDKVYFRGATDGYGRELWSTDGTAAGTAMVVDANPGAADSVPWAMFSVTFNDELFFLANYASSQTGQGEIWKTNGTAAGSEMVITFDGTISGMTVVGENIFFLTSTEAYTYKLWKTNGTQSGTVLVKDGLTNWGYTFLGSVNGIFIFTVQPSSTNNSQVWRSDGTNAGTYPLTTANVSGNGSSPSGTTPFTQYINYNGKLYFVTRNHLYATDGTLANTNIVAPLWNGSQNIARFGDVIEIDGNMYFMYYSADLLKLSIFKSDGTAAGTSEIYTVTSTDYFYPSSLEKNGNELLFTSVNENGGTSVFSLNTSTNAVENIVEIEADAQPPFYNGFTNGTLDKIDENTYFFTNSEDIWYRKGWLFDKLTGTIEHVAALDSVSYYIVSNEHLYFSKGNQLWIYPEETLGITVASGNSKISVYPNPATDILHFEGNDGKLDITIFDIYGRLVLDIKQVSGKRIDLSQLNDGVYIVRFNDGKGAVSKKVVKRS